MKVFHLDRFESDTIAIRIDLEAQEVDRRKKRVHVFRFEEAWTKDSICEKAISQLWNGGQLQGYHKINVMQQLEVEFKELKVGTIGNEIKIIEEKLGERLVGHGVRRRWKPIELLSRKETIFCRWRKLCGGSVVYQFDLARRLQHQVL